MAVNHGKIGDLAGFFARLYDVFDDHAYGGAAYTADGLNQIRTEAEALFDLDDDHRFILKEVLALIEAAQRQAGINVQAATRIFHLAARQIIRGALEPKSTASSLDGILRDLYQVMLTDAKTVQENRITVGTITAHGSNVGTGTLVVYDEAPLLKDDEERIQTQDIVAYCRADATQNGTTTGHETFQLLSDLRGNGPQVRVKWNEAYAENRITNHSFETGTVGATPTSWTVVTGTGGTHIKKDATEFQFGAASLHFDGDGAVATIEVKQAETVWAGYDADDARVLPLVPYLLSCWIKTSGSVAGRTITIKLKGTGYTEATSEKIEITASFPTSWTLYTAKILMPKNAITITNLALHVLVSGTLGAAENVYFDGLSFAAMDRWSDVGAWFGFTKGVTDFIAGPAQADRFTFTLTNDEASKIQTFLTKITNRRVPQVRLHPDIGVALPSAAAESAEYVDTKAD